MGKKMDMLMFRDAAQSDLAFNQYLNYHEEESPSADPKDLNSIIC